MVRSEGLGEAEVKEVPLLSVAPPTNALERHLPADSFANLRVDISTGAQIFEQLLKWQKQDMVLASRLEPFFAQVEANAEALRAGEPMPLPILKGEKRFDYSDLIVYKVEAGA